MLIRGAFQDVIYDRWEDECSPTRHFFAKLGLCKHKGKYVKTTMAKDLKKIFREEYRPTRTWFVDLENGDDSKDGLSMETAFKTPDRAYEAAAVKGDVIYKMGPKDA